MFKLMAFVSFLIVPFFIGCSQQDENSVTVYVSEDQVFSQAVLKEFEKQTGIKVNALYDSEESKSTGVMNRLIAEKNNPQADVYWANEPIRAEVLRQKGILAPYESPNSKGISNVFKEKNHFWCGFSARIRLFVVKNGVKKNPSSIKDYTNQEFYKKGVIANPLFGTTTSHIAALFTIWGEKRAKEFLDGLKKNSTAISTSNGESADLVALGKYDFSLVDSDDALSRLADKKDIHFVYPDQGKDGVGIFVVPNTVMLISGAPHEKNAKRLIDFLLSKKSEEMLSLSKCAQIPLHEGVKKPKDLKSIEDIKVMQVDYANVAKKLIEIQPYLKTWLEK